jgi:cysteinyl-tRNA synthetase
VHPGCLRFYLLSKAYRKSLDFSMEEFGNKACACESTGRILAKLKRMQGKARNRLMPGVHGDGRTGKKIARKLISSFEKAMDDDLDTGRTFREIFAAFSEIKAMVEGNKLSGADAAPILAAMGRIDSVLGVFL